MRIRRISIASFGRIRDRDIGVSDGLTVIHGPNESGKTTVMEFIRNALVPTNKRDVYPERAKTDSGSIVFDDKDGDGTLTLTQKTRGGDVPESIARLDPDLYRSIFAMSQKDLDDAKAVTSDEMSSRFLSVPGGENMPAAMETISDRVDSELGKTKSSRSNLNACVNEISELDSEIARLRSKAEGYTQLAGRKAELEAELENVRSGSEEAMKRKAIYDRYESQRENYRLLQQERRRLSDLGEFKRVSEEDEQTERKLESELEMRRKALDEHRSEVDGLKEVIGIDDRRVPKYRDRMNSLISRWGEVDGDDTEKTEPVAPLGRGNARGRPMFLIGMVIALAGIIGAVVTPYSLLLTAVGALVMGASVKRGRGAQVQQVQGPSTVPSDKYADEVAEVCEGLGLPRMDTRKAVDRFGEILETYSKLKGMESTGIMLNANYLKAKGEQDTFLMLYSGKDGFEECRRRSRTEREAAKSVELLKQTISNAGLDPDVPECPVEKVEVDTTRQESVSRDIGMVGMQMKQALDTTRLDEIVDRRAVVSERMKDVLRKGAVAYLASVMASEACDDVYSEVHPGVAAVADRYLSMMTDGRYRIDLDPRRRDNLSIVGDDGTKGPKQWSTGLRAQVLLSLKLAIAKEMGGGEVPMILDDVLLTFDTSRKEGAVRALAEVASEMQILMFTCDDQTRDIARDVEGVEIIEMSD